MFYYGFWIPNSFLYSDTGNAEAFAFVQHKMLSTVKAGQQPYSLCSGLFEEKSFKNTQYQRLLADKPL
jgi:hypothetical protein